MRSMRAALLALAFILLFLAKGQLTFAAESETGENQKEETLTEASAPETATDAEPETDSSNKEEPFAEAEEGSTPAVPEIVQPEEQETPDHNPAEGSSAPPAQEPAPEESSKNPVTEPAEDRQDTSGPAEQPRVPQAKQKQSSTKTDQPAVQKHTAKDQQSIIKKDNIIYYLDSKNAVTRSEEYAGDALVRIREYYQGASLENAVTKYIFNIDNVGSIINAAHLDEITQKITSWYEYYANTKYGSHGKSIKFKFDVNRSGHITKAARRENGTQRTTNRYEYYAGTVYGKHSSSVKYKFDLNRSGYVTRAAKRENGTQRTTNWYEYYSKTSYGRHAKKIRFRFDMNRSGYIGEAVEKENGTRRTLSWYKYKPNTRYGSHAARIIGRILNVPAINQNPELPTGCEITATAMMLRYQGSTASHIALARAMPRHASDPNKGYVGNPFTKGGWTIYPPALTGLIKKHAGSAQNLTGTSNKTLEHNISAKKPVVIWASRMHGFTVHAITLTGYDQDHYYYNDPWTGEKNIAMTKNHFNQLWNNQKKRAVTF